MDIKYNNTAIGIMGRKMSGKTYLTKFLLKSISPDKVYVLDTNGAYKGLGKRYSTDISFRGLDLFINKIREIKGNKMVVFDDLDVYSPLYSNQFLSFNINARNNGIGIIWNTKRPKRLGSVLIENADYLFLGRGLLNDDLEFLNDSFNIDLNMYNTLKEYEFLLYDTNTQMNTKIKAGEL